MSIVYSAFHAIHTAFVGFVLLKKYIYTAFFNVTNT